MAGELAGFDPAEFRAAIRVPWRMALAPDPAWQPVFVFAQSVSYDTGVPVDGEGVPLVAGAQQVSAVGTPPVSGLVVGLQWLDRAGVETRVGDASTVSLVITVLDEDFPQVSGAVAVELGGERYTLQRVSVSGLGPVGFYRMVFDAVDAGGV